MTAREPENFALWSRSGYRATPISLPGFFGWLRRKATAAPSFYSVRLGSGGFLCALEFFFVLIWFSTSCAVHPLALTSGSLSVVERNWIGTNPSLGNNNC